MPKPTSWPKVVPPLSDEDQVLHDDFVRYWHEVLPRRYGLIERFNHRYPLRSKPRDAVGSLRTLELGAGLGEHLEYEDLTDQQYTCVEIRANQAATIEARFPGVEVIVADCQQQLPFDEASFDRIIAVHVLEHLPDLPSALDECHRLLRQGGVLGIVIPCDPGLAYGVARRLSAQRIFERRYGRPYGPFIRREHINSPREIVDLVRERFHIVHRRRFPWRVPPLAANLVLGFTATK
ncbi:MAG TPA: class I SAM-dependent methyltransferase [Acidimicrobiia bacterium]